MSYEKASDQEVELVKKLRTALVSQNLLLAHQCFHTEFGMHCGQTLDEYLKYEMEEYALKCQLFGLGVDGPIQVFKLSEDVIYFFYGNEKDPALFEATWDLKEGVLVGNQSKFRWEPKLQVVKDAKGQRVQRVCNIKSKRGVMIKGWVLQNIEIQEPETHESQLSDILGGGFTSCIYTQADANRSGYWAKWRVVDSEGQRETAQIWMRGVDHPLFEKGEPWFHWDREKNTVDLSNVSKTVVILSVGLASGERLYYKYPKEKFFEFNQPIETVCLTDGLSYDWIENKN